MSSSVSRASKYSVSLSTDTSSTVLSGTVGSVGSMSVSESSGSGDANEMNLFGVMSAICAQSAKCVNWIGNARGTPNARHPGSGFPVAVGS